MKWGYGSSNGPEQWRQGFPIADGDRQSPIDIVTTSAEYDQTLTSVVLTPKYDLEPELEIVNTGHSLCAKIQKVSELTGGPLQNTYRLEQFHFHWGQTDSRGSEHTIDGKEYPSELHLVHYNCDKYKTFGDAAKEPDGLAVLGVMIKVGEKHLGFDTLCESAEHIKEPDEKYTIRNSFTPACLLPGNTSNYWTYEGSLTTPPLYESVTWIVLRDPLEISKEQLLKFRALIDSDKQPMQDNFRPPCPLKGRKLRKSFH